jgi:hypothetical protein
MDSSTLWRWILIGILIIVAINVLGYVLKVIGHLVSIGLTIAIIVAIIWLLFNVLSRRNTY